VKVDMIVPLRPQLLFFLISLFLINCYYLTKSFFFVRGVLQPPLRSVQLRAAPLINPCARTVGHCCALTRAFGAIFFAVRAIARHRSKLKFHRFMRFNPCVFIPIALSAPLCGVCLSRRSSKSEDGSKGAGGCSSRVAQRAHGEINVHRLREFGCSSGRLFERKG